MNTFYTDRNPVSAAREHCLVHTRKMIVEYTQLLATAHRLIDGVPTDLYKVMPSGKLKKYTWHLLPTDHIEIVEGKSFLKSHAIYKATHANHPSAVWVRKSVAHYQWVYDCAMELCVMYQEATGKVHATQAQLELLRHAPIRLRETYFVEPPVSAPDEFKAMAVLQGAAIAYKAYLNSKFAEWQSRAKPIRVDFIKKLPDWVENYDLVIDIRMTA